MNAPSFRHRAYAAALAVAAALGASAVLGAEALPGEGEEADGSIPQEACDAVGCIGGARLCGSIQSTQWLWIWVYPGFYLPVEVKETRTCYERSAA